MRGIRFGCAAVLAVGMTGAAWGQDATWLLNPGSNNFNTGTNWSTGTVPTGVASFGSSNTTTLNFNATTLGSIAFLGGAPAYTLSATGATIELNGQGFINNSSVGHTVNLDSSSELTFKNSSSAANITINNNGGQLNFLDSSTASGATINNTGSTAFLAFEDSSTASNATVHNTGGAIMCFCANADPANLTVFNGTGSSVRFNGGNTSNNMRYVGQGGTFDLSGMTASSVSIGSIEGSGTIDLGGNSLTAGSLNTSTTFSGDITGGGTFVKAGTGTLTLSGTNTLTGDVTVAAGQLLLTGSVAGGVQVNSGASFGGSGTVGGDLTNSGGTLMGGSALSTLTVTGNFTQGSGTYQVAVSGTSQNTKISVGGTASLGGTVNLASAAGGAQRDTRYTILTATGGRTGTFSGATTSSAFFTPVLSYDANNAYLTLALASNAFTSGAQTGNQKAVGAVLDQAAPNATGDFGAVINAVGALDSAQGSRALDMIGGQNYAAFSTVSVQTAQAFMNSFSVNAGTASGGGSNRVALALASDGDCGVDACPAPLATPWGAWAGGIAGAGTVAGSTSALGVSYSLGGFSAGLDYRFDRELLAGITTGYTRSTQFTQQLDGRGTSDTVQLGLYGQYTPGDFYLDALAGYARSQNHMQRPIVIPGLQPRTAHGDAGANQFFGMLEAGYRIGLDHPSDSAILPFARLQASTSTQDAFSEWGADSLDLNVAQQTTNSLRSVTGAQLQGRISTVDLRFRLGWSHEFADTSRPVTASFAGAPALNFTTMGAAAPRDGAVVGLGANAQIADATSLYARYDGEVQGGNTSHIFSAGVRMVW